MAETPVHATTDGTIVRKGHTPRLGHRVVIRDKAGQHWHSVGHFKSPSHLNVGDTVKAGSTRIGYMGQSGRATGPHVHVGLKNFHGKSVNPVNVPGYTPPLKNSRITSNYGSRIDPITHTRRQHNGVDYVPKKN